MRLLKEGTITTFLCRLLVALALLALPSVSRVLHHLANNAVFVIAHEELVMGQDKRAPAWLLVFAKTSLAGPFSGAFRATLFTVVELVRLGHGWREAGVFLGVVL